MSGPPYPHPSPRSGAGAIGSMVIGIDPIGTFSQFDVWTTVLSQYANSPIITRLITNMAAYLDRTVDFQSFFDTIFNIDTAVGYGLDVWGRILGVQRVLLLQTGGIYFGFEEQGLTIDGFGQEPFFSGQPTTNNFPLSDSAFRQLLIAKALFNICSGSIPAINAILLTLFPNRGACYVIDNGNMTMIYRFKFFLTPVEVAIVTQSGAIPRTAGVSASVVQGP
jgi:hypothetical protein